MSATTRPQRPGEQDGVDYWFLDRAEFDRRIHTGEFLEWVDYVGNSYGTLNSEIERPPTFTARLSGRSRLPRHTEHNVADMKSIM